MGGRRRGRGAICIGYLVALVAGSFGLAWPSGAGAQALERVCPPQPGRYECQLLASARPTTPPDRIVKQAESPDTEIGESPVGPQELHEAYKLPETGGAGRTIAIVDAFNDPKAESDLNMYRNEYHLYYKGSETVCTEANGCFRKVNQAGESGNYPDANAEWGREISLDLEMAAAICHECHILLVESTSNSSTSMDAAENEAASYSAPGFPATTVISNSWGKPDSNEETSRNIYFTHAGIPITFSAGDSGYGVAYPAASPSVIAVGGTLLKRATGGRGWEESVSAITGSGCSAYEGKPAWQKELPGCAMRIDNDVSAVAAIRTYDSYEHNGWENVWGTSVSSPIIAAVEALADKGTRNQAAEAFYSNPGMLFDITEGSNGTCTFEYLCTALSGYDGPSGWGTPDGVFGEPKDEWRVNGAVLTKATEVTWKGKIQLTAHGVEATVECEDAGTGSAGPGLIGEVTKWTASKCRYIKTGPYCEEKNSTQAPSLVAEALPWKSELGTAEGVTHDVLFAGNGARPRITLRCFVLGVRSWVAVCTGNVLGATTNTSIGVTDELLATEELECESHVNKPGPATLEGAQSIEAVGGGKLEADM
jgi:hypothetical protein